MLANMYAVKKVKLVNNRLEKLHRSQQQAGKRHLAEVYLQKNTFLLVPQLLFFETYLLLEIVVQ